MGASFELIEFLEHSRSKLLASIADTGDTVAQKVKSAGSKDAQSAPCGRARQAGRHRADVTKLGEGTPVDGCSDGGVTLCCSLPIALKGRRKR
jgi:hypothetical protein